MIIGNTNMGLTSIYKAKPKPQAKPQISFGAISVKKDIKDFQNERNLKDLDPKMLYKRDRKRAIAEHQPHSEKYIEILRTAGKGSDEWLKARNNLEIAFLPIVLNVAGSLSSRTNHEYLDLAQEGSLLLIDILEDNLKDKKKIDYNQSAEKVGAFVKQRLWWDLPKWMREEDAITHVTSKNRIYNHIKFQQAIKNLWIENQGKRAITNDEAAEKMKIPKHHRGDNLKTFDSCADRLCKVTTPISTSTPLSNKNDSLDTLEDTLQDWTDSIETKMQGREIVEILGEIVPNLPERQRDVIQRRLFKDGEFIEKPESGASIGKSHGVSREIISREDKRALALFQRAMAEELDIDLKKTNKGDFRELSLS